jgi:nicotinate-nucleotide adenylyltransferase
MRLGLFGGTFNPVHRGHLAAAGAAMEAVSLGRLLFIPSGHPPLKGNAGLAPGHHRIAMLRLAIGGDPRLGICDYEVERDGPSYTVDTIRRIASEAGSGTDLVFLLGSDCAGRLPCWKGIEEIEAMARFAIIARDGADLSGLPPKFLTVAMPPVPASSTAARAALVNGQCARELVGEQVMDYLLANHLFGPVAGEAAHA